MDANIKKKFEFLKSDISCEDIQTLATRSDVESIACACIKQNNNVEGCNLLTEFGRLLQCDNGHHRLNADRVKTFVMALDEAEKRLS